MLEDAGNSKGRPILLSRLTLAFERRIKSTPRLLLFTLVFILSIAGLVYTFHNEVPPSTVYQREAVWPIPHGSPKVKVKAQKDLQQFCKKFYKEHLEPPPTIQVKWAPTKHLVDMAIPGPAPLSIEVTDTNIDPVLFRVDGILPITIETSPDVQDTYSIYVFQSMGNGENDIVSEGFIKSKGWEASAVYLTIKKLSEFAEKHNLPRSEVYFVDIGANIGAFSMAVAKAGFNVIAIEAMSVNQFALSLSVCTNAGMARLLTLLPVALGKDKEATCPVFSIKGNVLDGTIRCGVEQMAGFEKRQEVEIVRLDDLLAEWIPHLKGRVGALKMDTEGFEPWVIEGGTEFFSTVRPNFMQMEISQMSFDATGVDAHELLQTLVGYGYDVRDVTYEGAPVLDPLTLPIPLAGAPSDVYLTLRQ